MKIINIVGARPNFMKIAPLMAAMKQSELIEPVLVHTGQHYDENLSKVFFEDLGIPRPDLNLEVGSGSRLEQIAAIKERFFPVLKDSGAELVLVVGDVNSTIACAEVAKELGVKVAHVEAGLRSFDKTMPEELNRIETDMISDYLFLTESSGLDNLRLEKVPGKAFLVGNVMIDTLVSNLKKAENSNVLSELELCPNQYITSTFHRPSNVDSEGALSRIIQVLVSASERMPIVLPLHPRTKHSLEAFGMLDDLQGLSNVVLIEPQGYLDFLRLVSNSKVIITDSGGLQEETTYLGVPCITMRNNTERPVTVDVGTNVLVGEDVDEVLAQLDRVVSGDFKDGQIPELWDGKAAERIVSILLDEFKVS